MKSNIKIRPATVSDLPILLKFEQGIIEYERPMDETLRREDIIYYDLKELISSSTSEVIVAEFEGELVGSGYVKIKEAKSYLDHDRFGYVGFMYVAPEYRGKGINKMVNDALLSWAKEHDVNEIRLEVYDQNDSAIRAYEKAGYSKNLIEMRIRI